MNESEQRYHVIFTGYCKPDLDLHTVKCNLILEMGLPENKVEELFAYGRQVLLKRCATSVEAQKLAERFERAGAMCVINDRMESSGDKPASGESSSLIRLLNKFIPNSKPGGPAPKPNGTKNK